MAVRVLRERPTPRHRLEGFSGTATLRAKALSRIHVGAGPQAAEARRVDRSALRRLREMALRMGKQAVSVLEREAESIFAEEVTFPVYRLGGKPAVPGTTLKGVVRSRIELSMKADEEGVVPSCFSVGDHSEVGPGSRLHREIYPNSDQNRGPRCDLTRGNSVCRICDIFGAPGLASRVGFGPLVFDVETEVLRLPRGGVEVIPEGAESRGTVYFTGLSEEELGVLVYGLGAAPGMGPIPVGGWRFHRLAGFPMGKLQLEIERWRFRPAPRGSGKGRPEVSGEEASKMAAELWKRARDGDRFGRWLQEVREYERLEEIWEAGG